MKNFEKEERDICIYKNRKTNMLQFDWYISVRFLQSDSLCLNTMQMEAKSFCQPSSIKDKSRSVYYIHVHLSYQSAFIVSIRMEVHYDLMSA